MGARPPQEVNKYTNKPRPMVRCDVCGRKFLNVSALKSHRKFLHEKVESRRVAFKRQENTKPAKNVVPVGMLRRVSRSPSPKTKANATEIKVTQVETPDSAGKSVNVSKKPEFECPVCAERFPVYFTTFRHIQKNHCVNEKGEEVPPNSPHLVTPIRIETCASCGKQIRSTEPHTCPKEYMQKDQYLCLGCKQLFNGLLLFQHHVKGLHGDGEQNFFFPSREEFESWKGDIQEQTKTEFVQLNRKKAKEMYHCSHQSTTVLDITQLCPSTIVVREYTKGVHVCYYKEHHGHTIGNIPLNQHNKYSISLFTRETEDLKLDADDDNDLYQQFKKMVTCIVLDATKVDVATLKELLGKAFEMTSVLKHYRGNRSSPLICTSLTNYQISRTLDSLKPAKRKPSPERKAPTRVVPKRVKKGSTSVDNSVENGVTTRLSRSSTTLNKSSPAVNKSVSFSVPKKKEESPLKEIEETPQKKIEETPQKKNQETPQRKTQETLQKKTQETRQKSLPKKIDEQKSALKKAEERETVPKKLEEPEINKPEETPITTPPRSLLQSPSSFNDSYKNFVDQNFKCQTETSTPKPKTIVKKKEVVKTKMGQFKVKPSVLPNILSRKTPMKPVKEVFNEPVAIKPLKAKVDIKYEVKEQENDCNILILKI